MFRLISSSLIALCLMTSGAAYAQNNMMGIGAARCADILTLSGSREFQITLMAWTTGFFTGANMATISTEGVYRDISTLNRDQIAYDVQSFCSANPSAPVIAVIERMLPSFRVLKWKAP
jgi:hypothetical protein